MSNMSYCMYENTAHDLRQVVDDIEERVSTNNEDLEPLSSSERQAAGLLYDLCLQFIEAYREDE